MVFYPKSNVAIAKDVSFISENMKVENLGSL